MVKKLNSTKKALIQNIHWGCLNFQEFSLGINETKSVEYTKKIRSYASEKYIKIIKIY